MSQELERLRQEVDEFGSIVVWASQQKCERSPGVSCIEVERLWTCAPCRAKKIVESRLGELGL